jgi:hypothetical protein
MPMTERTHAVDSAAVAARPNQPRDLHHRARDRAGAWRGVRIDRIAPTESRDAGRPVPDRLTATLSYHQESNFELRPGEKGPAMLLPSFARRPWGGPACSLRSTKGTAGHDVRRGRRGGGTRRWHCPGRPVDVVEP